MSKTYNPFPGLRSFRIDEKYLFFGREEHTAELLRRLRETRFLAVVVIQPPGFSGIPSTDQRWAAIANASATASSAASTSPRTRIIVAVHRPDSRR